MNTNVLDESDPFNQVSINVQLHDEPNWRTGETVPINVDYWFDDSTSMLGDNIEDVGVFKLHDEVRMAGLKGEHKPINMFEREISRLFNPMQVPNSPFLWLYHGDNYRMMMEADLTSPVFLIENKSRTDIALLDGRHRFAHAYYYNLPTLYSIVVPHELIKKCLIWKDFASSKPTPWRR